MMPKIATTLDPPILWDSWSTPKIRQQKHKLSEQPSTWTIRTHPKINNVFFTSNSLLTYPYNIIQSYTIHVWCIVVYFPTLGLILWYMYVYIHWPPLCLGERAKEIGNPCCGPNTRILLLCLCFAWGGIASCSGCFFFSPSFQKQR